MFSVSLIFGCATVSPAPAAPDRHAHSTPAFDYDAAFETSCPRGIPTRFPSDLVVQFDRPGERWSLVAEGRDCEPDLMDSLTPPFGWDHPPRRCARVPETQLRTLHRTLSDAQVDRIRVRDAHGGSGGASIVLTWRNASAFCRVGADAIERVHRDDRASFAAAMRAVESTLPPDRALDSGAP